jgi:hypothetical protein
MVSKARYDCPLVAVLERMAWSSVTNDACKLSLAEALTVQESL